jgi:hypothetical protein
MTGQRAVAEEIVHDAFLRAHGRWDSIDTPAAYLRRTVVNLCLTWRARAALARSGCPGHPTRSILPSWMRRGQRSTGCLAPSASRWCSGYYEELPDGEVLGSWSARRARWAAGIHRALKSRHKEMTP